jgi:lipopolysaccharide export system protein LptA
MMKRPPIEQIRRLVLVALVAVALVVGVNYGWRRWQAYQARQSAPTTVPGDVQQQAERLTLSRSEAGQTLFTVEAARTTERAGKTTVLENVVVKVYGRRGERSDEIRTARCEYDVTGTGHILCPGEVSVHVSSGAGGADDPKRAVELTTSAVHFDPASGSAWTDEPVRFSFPQGSGEAIGLRYQGTDPAVQFEKQISIQASRGGTPMTIQASQLRYFAREQAFELVPPLEVRAGERVLIADRLRMELDSNFQVRKIEATGNVRASGRYAEGAASARAAQMVAEFGTEGRIGQLRAAGQVMLERQGAKSREQLACDEAVMFFASGSGEAERVTASGSARLLSTLANQTRELRAPTMELKLQGAKQVLTARPHGTPRCARPKDERTLTAERIDLQFENKDRARLECLGRRSNEADTSGRRSQASTSQEMRARFDDEGGWPRPSSGANSVSETAGRRKPAAPPTRPPRVYHLSEQPVFWDALSRTTARSIDLEEKTEILRAEGDVRTTYRSTERSQPGFGTGEPVQLAADKLRAERASGRARYEGRARMWQGESRLAAAVIDLYQNPNKLVAEGDVSGLFVEARKEAPADAEKRRAVEVASQRATYVEGEHRVLFEEQVVAHNDFGTLHAPELELFLAPGAQGNSSGVERALARGGVLIEQGTAQATGERAEYSAAAQTVSVWGGAPKITDPTRGSTAGDRLTLFLADGTLRVDSAEGARTVTRRPWTR